MEKKTSTKAEELTYQHRSLQGYLGCSEVQPAIDLFCNQSDPEIIKTCGDLFVESLYIQHAITQNDRHIWQDNHTTGPSSGNNVQEAL